MKKVTISQMRRGKIPDRNLALIIISKVRN